MNGRIVIPANTNVWPHELETAKALANHGYVVEFRKKNEGYRIHTADVLIDGVAWEFKAPNGSSLNMIERNLRRAKNQSGCIVFDSIRIKKIPDSAIKRELIAKAHLISGIHKIIFINRKRECIDIYERKK